MEDGSCLPADASQEGPGWTGGCLRLSLQAENLPAHLLLPVITSQTEGNGFISTDLDEFLTASGMTAFPGRLGFSVLGFTPFLAHRPGQCSQRCQCGGSTG